MIYEIKRGESNMLYENEFFDKVFANVYKNTPYSIVKEPNNNWIIYIIVNKDIVYCIERTSTKSSAIKRIENKTIYNEIKTQFYNYFNVLDILQDYMINNIENNDENSISSTR
jgi:hypothetical protein